jgi:GNAT superfamily N-acetyltransferase
VTPEPARRGYRSTAVLCGVIVAGWAWDLRLGGGRAHSLAWLAALVLVGGISALSVRAARDSKSKSNHSEPPQTALREVRPAVEAEFGELIAIERAADTLFSVAGYGAMPPPADLEDLAHAALLLVAGTPPIGYIRVEFAAGHPHIESLSIRPKFMRRGIGSALVEAACNWAAEQGFGEITLCTFAEVPWNGPFYASLGFSEVPDPSPELRELRAEEARLGLDAVGRRCVMRRDLQRAGTLDG